MATTRRHSASPTNLCLQAIVTQALCAGSTTLAPGAPWEGRKAAAMRPQELASGMAKALVGYSPAFFRR